MGSFCISLKLDNQLNITIYKTTKIVINKSLIIMTLEGQVQGETPHAPRSLLLSIKVAVKNQQYEMFKQKFVQFYFIIFLRVLWCMLIMPESRILSI